MLYDSLSINTFLILDLLVSTGLNTYSVYLTHHGSSTNRSLGALGRTESMVSFYEQGESLLKQSAYYIEQESVYHS